MKKRVCLIGMSIAALALLIWCVPIAIGLALAKPMEGSFLIANCVCGHDVFYLIEGGSGYDFCPGHKEKDLIGPVVTNDSHLTVLRAKDGIPCFELKLQDGTHFLRLPGVENDDWHPVERISNPWRTSWRVYLPE